MSYFFLAHRFTRRPPLPEQPLARLVERVIPVLTPRYAR